MSFTEFRRDIIILILKTLKRALLRLSRKRGQESECCVTFVNLSNDLGRITLGYTSQVAQVPQREFLFQSKKGETQPVRRVHWKIRHFYGGTFHV